MGHLAFVLIECHPISIINFQVCYNKSSVIFISSLCFSSSFSRPLVGLLYPEALQVAPVLFSHHCIMFQTKCYYVNPV